MKPIYFFVLLVTACTNQNNLKDSSLSTNEKFKKAVILLKNNKNKEGVNLLISCANDGHGGCAQRLGYQYTTGIGVRKNIDNAVKWYKIASDSGTKYGAAGLFSAFNMALLSCSKEMEDKVFSETKYWLERSNEFKEQLEKEIDKLNQAQREVIEKDIATTESHINKFITSLQQGYCLK